MTSDEKHPIAAAVVALLTVGLAVGLLLGVVTLIASHVVGLGDGGEASATDAGPSLYLPSPSPTHSSLAPAPATAPTPAAPSPQPSKPAKQITLQAGATSVAAMQRIDLSGVYQSGEGAVLQVQRMGAGANTWVDFPVTASVSGGTFSTYVQTGQAGVQKFRVRDSGTGKVSNVVKVTVR